MTVQPDESHAGSGVRTSDFGGLAIDWDPRVLEPRPWTTAQSHWAAELMEALPGGRVLELCSGAGHIGLLAVAGSDRELVCVDVNPVACEHARRNAARAGLGDRVEVREGRLDEVIEADERFPLVVADPPWVPRAETGRFPEDPTLAIDGGDDGLDLARLCWAVAERHLADTGAVVLQLGTTEQAERLAEEAAGPSRLRLREVRRHERGVLALLTR